MGISPSKGLCDQKTTQDNAEKGKKYIHASNGIRIHNTVDERRVTAGALRMAPVSLLLLSLVLLLDLS
jgi:hypothetical protein